MKKNIYKKKILRPPDWPQSWPPVGQETNFFLRVASRRVYCGVMVECRSGTFVYFFFFLVETEKNVCDRRLIVMSLSLLMYIAVVVV